ncbi:MAG: hypothetical protein GAK31_01446 [Stenotrophomonas maltophilia]|uniref:Uncharacterized protein n=1 Tax=Stenotrophomonas maltophilia TaxID=40324 RepID=A0A7V8FHR6_STEMA|nr:MAG: hypothetical protein GAK31_01446 [Stenotrophomonas maltophilia]
MGVLAVLLLALAVWLVSRCWPVPAAQRQALAQLDSPVHASGRNGFAQLWLLAYDGPDAAGRERLLAEDVARWQGGLPGQRAGVSVAAERLHAVPLGAGSRCGTRGIDCLAQVRAEPQRFARVHQGHAALHARVADLAGYGHFRSPFVLAPRDVCVPLPALLPLMDPGSAHALAFVQGDHAAGLAGICATLLAGRRLVHGSDALVTSVLGAALVETQARLLSEMLAELPAGQPLPPACHAALQPMGVDEQDLCPALRGEFALSTPALDAESARLPWNGLVFDVQATRLCMAPHYAWACGSAARQALAEDRPLEVPPAPPQGIECLSNILGCRLAAIAFPAIQPYAARSQDAAAMLRLVAAQCWLRQQPGPRAQALSHLPAEMRSATRVPELGPDGLSL